MKLDYPYTLEAQASAQLASLMRKVSLCNH